jgi:Uma2 family endonuclease
MAVGTTRTTRRGKAGVRVAAAAPTDIDDESVSIESLYRLSVEAYHAMIRAGILTEDDSVELLDGLLVLKMAKNPPHIVATELLQRALSRVVPEGWYVSMQNPVTTGSSEPEPDGKVVKGDPRTYLKRKPGPRNVPIAIEVSDDSLRRDRTVKKRIYAAAGISNYWIINLIDRCVEVYTEPTGPVNKQNSKPDYRKIRTLRPDESLVVILGGREVGRIAVRDLLP